MATLGEVAESLAAACEKAADGRAALERAEQLAEDARALFAVALEGSTASDKGAVLDGLAETVKDIKALWKVLDDGIDAAEALLDVPRGACTPPVLPPVQTSTPQPRTTTAAPVATPAPVPPERIEELRRDLPPPVVPGTGQKTHGRWIAPDGTVQQIVSERDEWSTKVNQALTAEGCPKVPVVNDGDVELKLAARMREQGATDPAMRHVTLAINHVPRQGPLGCDTLVPVVLPDGYTLTVYGPGYYKQFTGGRPPWRR